MSDNFIPLEAISVGKPCAADWDAMGGGDRTRFCPSCEKNVYNLSDMSRHDAEKLVQAKEGRLCVQFYRRADGTVITDECPIGLRPVRNGARQVWRVAVTAVAAASALCSGMMHGIARGVTGVDSGQAAVPQVTRGDMAASARTMGAPMPPPQKAKPNTSKQKTSKPKTAAGNKRPVKRVAKAHHKAPVKPHTVLLGIVAPPLPPQRTMEKPPVNSAATNSVTRGEPQIITPHQWGKQ